MSLNKMLVVVFALFLGLWVVKGCSNSRRQNVVNQSVMVTSAAADGLDLKALLAVVKKAESAKQLETEINRNGGINNLDLNDDGKVDFIKVTEYGNKNDAWGFSLTTEPEKGQVQEIASIEMEKAGDSARVEVRGNEQVYGRGHYYHTHYPVGSFLLWSYLLSPHRYYVSPWSWGYYPTYYSPYPTVAHSRYSRRVRPMTSTTSAKRVAASQLDRSLQNPNRGKVAQRGIRKSLAQPTATQKQFQARSASKTRSGGFGRSSSRRSGGFGRSSSSGRRGHRSARGFSSYGGSFGGSGK